MTIIDDTYFARVFNNSSVFLIETQLATGEPIISATANINRLLGFTEQEIETDQLLFDDLIHEDDIAQYLLESQQGSLSEDCEEVVHSVYRISHKDGYFLWVKDAAQVIRKDNKAERILHVLTDVSEEVHLYRDLEDEKNRLVDVLHTSGFGLWQWYTHEKSITCDENWSSLIGFGDPVQALKLSRFFALIHPDEVITFRKQLEELGAGLRRSLKTTVRIRHLSGKWRYHVCTATSTPINSSDSLLVNMSHTDITEQKENELAAIAALATRNQFFARVSHEIRTPLHGILGMLSLLKRELAQAKAKEKIDKVISNSEHLLYLLNDILDLAKLNEAKLKISIELTSVTEIIKQVERLFAFKAAEKNIVFHTELPALQVDMVNTDKVRLTQILSNLVSNAIKYTNNGSVEIFTTIENEQLRLCVKDSGMGIKNKAAIFDAYSQEAGGYAQGPSSTGLGLEVVKKLSDLLGIEITLNSSPTGTLFQLTLGKPMPNTLVSVSPQLNVSEKVHDFSDLHILIVDDSDINREIVKEILEGVGAKCAEACDGYEAVKMTNRDNSYDVILMDKHMPNMNGIDATQQIRVNADLMTQPIIIALTADAFDIDTDKWFEVGVNEIITKPFDMPILMKTIMRCLRK